MRWELSSNPDVNFFLATDSPQIEAQIRNEFGEKIISNKKKLDRNSEEGIQDALVDLLCLSKTKKIYGSYWSSFSGTAALIGKIELIILRKGEVKTLAEA